MSRLLITWSPSGLERSSSAYLPLLPQRLRDGCCDSPGPQLGPCQRARTSALQKQRGSKSWNGHFLPSRHCLNLLAHPACSTVLRYRYRYAMNILIHKISSSNIDICNTPSRIVIQVGGIKAAETVLTNREPVWRSLNLFESPLLLSGTHSSCWPERVFF